MSGHKARLNNFGPQFARDFRLTPLVTCSSTVRLVRTITQTHGAQTLAPDLLNVIDSLEKVWYESLWVLCRRKMTESRHSFVLGTRDLVCSFLRHLGCV